MRYALILPLLCCAALVSTAEGAWVVGWKNAADQAKAGKKLILADFTGSDWCGWCMKLKKEVFDTPEFAAWAKDKVVLLEVDFPQQTQLPAKQAQENDALGQKYGIEGFPTILILDAKGKELGRLGYEEGGPAVWTAKADKLLASVK